MKIRNAISAVFAATAVCLASVTVWLSFTSMNASPVLLSPPEEARARVTEFMDAVCSADFEQAENLLYGNPSLGLNREPEDPVGKLLWDAYTDSLRFEAVGQCSATDNGISQKVQLTGLDIPSVTQNLGERSQNLLEQRVRQAEDAREVYDDKNEYREDFVMRVLYDAAKQALKEDATQKTMEFTLQLTYQDGQWMIVADNAMLNAISGGILY